MTEKDSPHPSDTTADSKFSPPPPIDDEQLLEGWRPDTSADDDE